MLSSILKEPTGCLVLEDYSVVPDEEAVAPFAFVVLFSVEPDKKHILTCANVGQVSMGPN